MVLLDLLQEHNEYSKILPHMRNGIIIDTSVMRIFLDGFILTHFSGKQEPQYEKLITLFHKLKIITGGTEDKYNWSKFIITPHILTEICRHIKEKYKGHNNHNKIIESIIPILKEINEKDVTKNKILQYVNIKNPIIHIGDISIFLVLEEYSNNSQKIAVLEKDGHFLEAYGDKNSQNVLVIDFDIVTKAIESI